MNNLMILNDRKEVVQHNHMVNGRFDLTSLELRVFIYMLAQINPFEDKEFKKCRIPVSFVTESTGGNTYKYLREFNNSLSKKTFILEELGAKNKRILRHYPVFGEVTYMEGENCIEAIFNVRITEYLLNISGNFTKSELTYLLELKNVHSFRIYWLLKQHLDFGERTIAYDDLKAMLFLSDKYSEFSNFKKKVLEIAKGDLAATDMAFTYEKITAGKGSNKVVKIKFTLTKDAKELAKAKYAKRKKDPIAPGSQTSLFGQQQAAPKYKPSKVSTKKERVLTSLTVAELKEMSKFLDYDRLVQSYLDNGFTWNEDYSVLSGYEREI